MSTTLSSHGVGPLAGVARLTPSVALAVVTVPGPLGAAASSSLTLPCIFVPFSPPLVFISTFPWSTVVRSHLRCVPLPGELSHVLPDLSLTPFVLRASPLAARCVHAWALGVLGVYAATRALSLLHTSCTTTVVVVDSFSNKFLRCVSMS